MKAIIQAYNPEEVERIARGEQTVKVCKTAPKNTPFKVYMYQTKESKRRFLDHRFNSFFAGTSHHTDMGKVMGEFVCDRVICCQTYYGNSGENHLTNLFGNEVKQTCLTEEELFNYIVGNKKEGTGWLWHVSDLKIYDKPKELSEFKHWVNDKDYNGWNEQRTRIIKGFVLRPLTRPPQSWCYIESLGE